LESEPYYTIIAFIRSASTNGFTLGVAVSFLVMLLLLTVSALVSGSEVAYFSLTPSDVNSLEESNNRISRMVIHHLKFPERLLATILITNNFVNVGIVIISTFITNTLFTFSVPSWVGFLMQVVAVTFLILFCSEIFPKIYANRFSTSFAKFTAPGLTFFIRMFWPISTILIYSTSIVNRRLIKHSRDISIDELSDALDLTETHLIEEKNILKGIVKFGNIDVCEIMKSRVDTVAAEINTPYGVLLKLIDESGYSRIPVYEENFDKIRGILYIKDLLSHLDKPANFEWQSLIRPSYFVPESKKINDLLKEFQNNRIHMAIVVDEYGGTSGIVTLEDVLEEIVGEITDESDEEEMTYEKIDSNNFIFEGKTLLNDFYKAVGVDDTIFINVKGEADTLAGLILELKGEIPKPDDKLAYKKFLFTIVLVDKRRIKKIKVTIKPQERNNYGG
jgi:gliding motility-associated protein GldE